MPSSPRRAPSSRRSYPNEAGRRSGGPDHRIRPHGRSRAGGRSRMTTRKAELHRETKETTIDVVLVLEGRGTTTISTGIPFFDHMLEQLGKHAGFNLGIDAKGDLEVDLHHTVEDVGIV